VVLDQNEDILVGEDQIKLVFIAICVSCQRLNNTDFSNCKLTFYISLFFHVGCLKNNNNYTKAVSEINTVKRCQTLRSKGSVNHLA